MLAMGTRIRLVHVLDAVSADMDIHNLAIFDHAMTNVYSEAGRSLKRKIQKRIYCANGLKFNVSITEIGYWEGH
jgi:hypothetical protein